MNTQPRWALFISGQGSNMSAVLDQKQDSGSVALVVSSRKDNFGLRRARRLGIPTLALDKKIDWPILEKELQKQKITHIFLLGFMKVIPLEFLQRWTKPILNVHPSLLPDYSGLHALERAYNETSDIGVTVHKVIADVDAGEIVLQKKVYASEVVKTISFLEVEQRVHYVEYDLVRKSLKVAACWT